MAWFNVDDSFWSHPKIMFLPVDVRGVWVTAGSWAACHLTDGAVPKRILRAIIPLRASKVDALCDELVAVGLWLDDGETWQFRDWNDYNRTRTQVEADRASTRARAQKYRERAEANRDRNGVRNGVTNGVTNGVRHGVSHAAQSNPIQSNTPFTPTPPPIAEVLAAMRQQQEDDR